MYGLRTSDFGLRTSDFGLLEAKGDMGGGTPDLADFGLRTFGVLECGLRTSDP